MADRVMLDQSLKKARRFYEAGQFQDAERICRQVLGQVPEHVDALLLLAALAKRANQKSMVAEILRRAAAARPDSAQVFNELGMAYVNLAQPDQAAQAFRKAIELQPKWAEVYNNLGSVLRDMKRPEEAVAQQSKAVEIDPNYAEAHYNLGNAYRDMKKEEEAIRCYRRAIEIRPNLVQAYNNMGGILSEQNKLEDAIEAYQNAVRLQPKDAMANNNLGSVLQKAGRFDESMGLLEKAIELKPDYASPYANRAVVYRNRGELESAIASCQKALQLKPDLHAAYLTMASTLRDQGRSPEALRVLQVAIQKKPDAADVHVAIADAYWEMNEHELAKTFCLKAIELDPKSADPHNNLGNIYKDQGQLDKSIEEYRLALKFKEDAVYVHSNLVYTTHFHAGYDAAKLLEENRAWAKQFEEPLLKEHKPHSNDRSPDRRLRIGYVSPYMWGQAESHFMVPLMESHDHQQVEVFVYSNASKSDATTDRFRKCTDKWQSIKGLRDEQAADMIRNDQVDILIDLAMHMSESRLQIFARKPAPVQVAYLAYPGGTGMKSMDYIISDTYMDPPGAPWSLYTEEPIRLPDCWCVYYPLIEVPTAKPRDGGPIMFGSLNNPCKMNDPILRIWAKAMNAVPDSRILLQSLHTVQQDQIKRILGSEGIDASRIEFVGRATRDQYLRYFDRTDICLDPLPYNGITTTCDSLWMGVPVVSLAGKTSAGRAGNSILRTVGLGEFATETPEQFAQVAAQLAGDRARLAELRKTLRPMFEKSIIMDGPRFARNVENAFRQIWKKWCQTAPAA